MKAKKIGPFKINLLIGILIAFIITGTLNSCGTSASITYENYTPPAWAPPYDDASSIQYYYFPDYDMYYDVWNDQFWYSNNGIWTSCIGLPPIYPNVDLYSAYVVLVNKKYHTPWNDNDYYARNYPAHSYDNYKNIVVSNRIVKNTAPNHELVARAFNENNNRVTFMQRPVKNEPTAPAAPVHTTQPVSPPQYHHISHEVPIKNITPYMPAESHNLGYGGGFKKH